MKINKTDLIKLIKEQIEIIIISSEERPRVFLGGTWNGSAWRDELEPILNEIGFDCFNPIVDDWNEEAQQRELQERQDCDYCLYTITPKMEGVYSIAEVVDDSNKKPEKTILLVLTKDDNEEFAPHEIKSLQMVVDMVVKNGGVYFYNFKDLTEHLKGKINEKE